MDMIKRHLDATLKQEQPITKEEMREIIDSIVYAEARAAKKRREEEQAQKEAEEKRMTLNKYIAMYTDQIESGARQTERGRNYAESTVKTVKLALDQFTKFQKETKRTYDFNDINMDFYYAYTAYLKKKKYSINTCGKFIKEIKAVMSAAESEGHHNNHLWRDKKFKGTRVEVDSIYLTKEDLDKMMAVDVSKLGLGHEQARDIFIEIETTKGGVAKKEKIEKWKLVHSHTARRTGATLMYLAGIDIYDIMKVTGHSSPKMLKKYIKADSLEVVRKLTDKYDYFR